jgi:hypothetical protein
MSDNQDKATQLKFFWREWCDKFIALPQERLTPQMASVFALSMVEERNPAYPPEEIKDSFPYRVFESRAQAIGLSTTDAVKTVIACFAENVGTVVMFVYVLRFIQHRDGKAQIGMTELTEAFLEGFPRQESLHALWDDQKGYKHGVPFDNILDQITFDPTL